MPLGFERVNERTQRPNVLINFIKPMPGPTSEAAEGILNRVAAICYPFMKTHMILVQALEEFPYNIEFVGRNFNAGEVIQLVLRDKHGRWLPQRMVEMVMVHELAHCKQMNHSKAFWKVRDAYADELRALWATRYTGEGMWGRGRGLCSAIAQSVRVDSKDLPEHLCGGTYSRRSRKRARGAKKKGDLSYAEKKQRRILKKFGADGQTLGADEDTKVKLEGGIAHKAKPRVAKSNRGRELRAAAALARFEDVKEAAADVKTEAVASSSESDGHEIDDCTEQPLIDVDGRKLVDDKGRTLIKICDNGGDQDANAERELHEIQDLVPPKAKEGRDRISTEDSKLQNPKPLRQSHATAKDIKPGSALKPVASDARSAVVQDFEETIKSDAASSLEICATCSLCNEPGSITCMACMNVLQPHLDANHWKCGHAPCAESTYVNSEDVNRCGLCGTPR